MNHTNPASIIRTTELKPYESLTYTGKWLRRQKENCKTPEELIALLDNHNVKQKHSFRKIQAEKLIKRRSNGHPAKTKAVLELHNRGKSVVDIVIRTRLPMSFVQKVIAENSKGK